MAAKIVHCVMEPNFSPAFKEQTKTCQTPARAENSNSKRFNVTRQILLNKRSKTTDCRQDSKPKKRSVSFHHTTKTWDGVSPGARNLQQLVYEFWTKRASIRVLECLLRDRKHDELCKLFDDLGEVIQRLRHLGSRKSTPLNPRGGGKAIMLTICHIPQMIRIQSITKVLRDKCARVCQNNPPKKNKAIKSRKCSLFTFRLV